MTKKNKTKDKEQKVLTPYQELIRSLQHAYDNFSTIGVDNYVTKNYCLKHKTL